MVAFDLLKSAILSGIVPTMDSVIYQLKLLLFQQRLWTLWFMACLFFLNILFYLLVKVCRKNWIVMVISMILPLAGLYYYQSGGTPLYWNIDVCVMAIPFFALGYLYKLYATRVDDVIMRTWRSITVFLVVAVINIITWRLSLDETGLGLDSLMAYGSIGVVAYKWITLIGIVLILTICNWCIGKLGLKLLVGK